MVGNEILVIFRVGYFILDKIVMVHLPSLVYVTMIIVFNPRGNGSLYLSKAACSASAMYMWAMSGGSYSSASRYHGSLSCRSWWSR